jgi:naphthalene 1,2-dioxygenase ferredoxin reductase component
MEVMIEPQHRTLDVQPGANLLDVLRAHQVPMSYSCTAGRCGICRCEVIDGDVLDAGKETQRPLDAEGRCVLACQTYLTEPCRIRLPDPTEVVVHPARNSKARVNAIEDLTHDVRRLLLKLPNRIAYSPGQYVHLQFANGHVRPYSMAGLCEDDELDFHVRVWPEGRASGHIANALKVGDAVRVSGPLGFAHLRHRHEGPMLCVAGGTGLGAILSIVRGALSNGMRNPIHLYLAARSPRDVYGMPWVDELRRLHTDLTVQVVVASGADRSLHLGGLVTDAIAADHPDLTGWRAYLRGSPPMVEATAMLTKRLGLSPDRVHADAFYTVGA